MSLLIPIAAMSVLGLLFAVGLVLAYKKLQVPIDPRLDKVAAALPQANCGACGYPGCQALAEAILSGRATPESCPVGGNEVAREIAGIMGVEAGAMTKKFARVHCRGTTAAAKSRGRYQGLPECRPAHLLGGNKLCQFGCMGFWDCVRACPFEAMAMGPDGLPVVFEDRCTGCGKCVEACPRQIMELHPADQDVLVFCCSTDRGPVARKVCDNACIGCGICVRDFPEAVTMENLLARVVDYKKIPPERMSELDKCPTKAIGKIGGAK